MRFTELNDDNYLLFALKYHENPNALTVDDFYEDLKKIKYVKRLLRRYQNTQVLKTPLVVNHLVVLFNVFGDAAIPLLFFSLERDLWPSIKSFIWFMGKFPARSMADIDSIPMDPYCLERLEKIDA